MDDKQQIFRKSGVERLDHPDHLNDYLRVTTPSVWAILLAVMILIAGSFVWAMNARLEEVIAVKGTVEQGRLSAVIVSENDKSPVKRGQLVHITVPDTGSTDVYISEIYRDANGRKVAAADTDLPDGEYKVRIVTDTMTPISFLLE